MASPYALDFNPLFQAIQNNQQFALQRNRLAQDEKRLGFEEQLQPLRLQATQQQIASAKAGEDRAAALHPLQLTQQQQQVDAGNREAQKYKAGLLLSFVDKFTDPNNPQYLKDQTEHAANWSKMLTSGPFKDVDLLNHPDIGPLLKDPTTGPALTRQILEGHVRGPVDPLTRRKIEAEASKDEAQGKLYGAQERQISNKGNSIFDKPKDQLEYEQGLRKEYTGQSAVKDFGTVRDAYGKIQGAANGSAAGDISLIFAYMKMLDPSSTVREGEFATAQNAAGVPDRVRNVYDQVMKGTRLNPEQRRDFIDHAGRIYGVHERQYNAVRGQFSNLARRGSIDPSAVTLDFGAYDEGHGDPYGRGPARPQTTPVAPEVQRFAAPQRAPQSARPTNQSFRPLPPDQHANALREANEAIAAGKNPAAVRERLRQLGVEFDEGR